MMKSVFTGLVLSAAMIVPADAAVPTDQWNQPAQPTYRHHYRHQQQSKSINIQPLAALKSEVAALRRDMTQVRAEVRRSPWEGLDIPYLDPLALPELRVMERQADLPAAPPAQDLDAARAYLVATATPGYTMIRQGVAVAIGRLHPAMAVRLADAIQRAREAGLARAGVFSAYRPPAFGVGGFSDKFNSLHSYGLAADVTGIGAAGSRWARVWEHCVRLAGLYLPYGPDNSREFNHTQLVPTRIAAHQWRATIAAGEPRDLRAMWLASGVRDYVTFDPPSSAALLPINELSR